MDKQEVIRTYSAAALAYIGDAAFEVYVRDFLVRSGENVNILHRKAKEFVCAAAQSSFMTFLEPVLTEEEMSVYRRGRNAKCHSHPKNADLAEYHRATGFEALFGFWHLSGDFIRQQEIFDCILTHRAN